MKKRFVIKRYMAALLAAALVITGLPAAVLADENPAAGAGRTGNDAGVSVATDGTGEGLLKDETNDRNAAAEGEPAEKDGGLIIPGNPDELAAGDEPADSAEPGGTDETAVPEEADEAEKSDEAEKADEAEKSDEAAETDETAEPGKNEEPEDPEKEEEPGDDALLVGEDSPAVDLTEALNGAASGTLSSGVYSVATAANPDFVLTAEKDNVELKGNISLGINAGKASQLFYVAALGGGKYRIENINSGYVFDCAGGGTEKGTNIQQYRVNSTAAQTFTIKETAGGLYTISATHCALVLDVEAGNAAEETNVRLWRSNGTAAQQWIFTKVMDPLPNGLYYLKNNGSGLTMQAAGGSYERRSNIDTGALDGGVSQRFAVRTTDGGATYTILNLYSRLTLDVEGGSKTSGANIQQYKINGTNAQKFRIIPLPDGSCRISSMLGSMPLSVSGTNVCQMALTGASDASQQWTFSHAPGDPAAGMYRVRSAKNAAMGLDIYGGDWNIRANVQLYTQTTTASQVNQQFILEDAGGGWFTITNVGTGKVLDKAGGAEDMANENVQQYRPNGTAAQKWQFVDTGDGDGSYYIMSGVGTYLDVKGGTMANGTNIQSHRGNKTAAQKWYLEPTAFSGTGWRTVNTYERSYYKDGKKLTGWQKIGSYYYYFNANGVMLYSQNVQGFSLDSRGRRILDSAAAVLADVRPGGLTLKNLLQNALIPCGRVLYVWGGGWNDGDVSRVGYLDSWGTFFKSHATSTYNRNDYRYTTGNGLDCSGYLAWVVYNTRYNKDGQFNILTQGSTNYTSTSFAQRIASLNWASYRSGAVGAYTDLRPGDIVSMSGHVWMYLGSCPDGSGVIIHSSPMGQTYGGGVQLAGTTDRNGSRSSEGYRLAKAYMEKYFKDWPYATNVCSVSYRSTAVGFARWKYDPDGFQSMSAQQVLQALLGNV